MIPAHVFTNIGEFENINILRNSLAKMRKNIFLD